MPRTLTPQRQREIEELARALLQQSTRLSPYELADHAKIDFFLARGVLRRLANRGQATELPSGAFGQPAPP
jgi:ribosomal protein S25